MNLSVRFVCFGMRLNGCAASDAVHKRERSHFLSRLETVLAEAEKSAFANCANCRDIQPGAAH